MRAPDEVLGLVERFERNRDAYTSGAYNETQARREFIDPLFCALGWDVENRAGYAEAYKDVIHEDAIKTSFGTKAPDYCFRIGGARKFFVEAKKPSVNVKDDVAPAYQLRRYAWSAKLPLSILTDFEEFAVYDCRLRPDKADKASAGRTHYLRYTDYDARWDEIAGVFAKEAVLQGSFDKYAESTKGKRGTAEVDAVFLQEIETWRDSLARHIALRNGALSQRELNYAVQATIDRLIFLRICEDRGTEAYGRLQGLLNGQNTYARLLSLYREADQRYNSGLFHFERERGRPEAPDELTPSLALDDKPLKEIIGRLYYPDSPYEFSVLPADILGQVYEQFLGKVIRLTAGHHAVVEDKPEVKKAGGVYYTPTYIVEYIVKNTVGKLLEGKTPKQAAALRILDPACGSGSFLIGAYQYLLDWHRDWYAADGPAKHKKELFQGPGGEWRLTTSEKKRILLGSVFGVDIDAQAVETTKLSLLLKVLEGETAETIDSQLSFLRERALPDLASNIKCGNSLIGPGFYDAQQLGLGMLDEEERYRINVFNWEAEFPQILGRAVPEAKRGFDAVIGNPPYIRINRLVDCYPREVRFIQSTYASAAFGKVDIYVAFLERGLSLLCGRGHMGFIVPNKFVQSEYGRGIRQILADAGALETLIDFGHAQVFDRATSYTCLVFLGRGGGETFAAATNERAEQPRDFLETAQLEVLPQTRLGSGPWSVRGAKQAALIDKLEHRGRPLAEFAEIAITGVKTGLNRLYAFDVVEDRQDTLMVKGEGSVSTIELERDYLRPYCKAESMKRYAFSPRRRVLLYPYRLQGESTMLVPEAELRDSCPLTWAHLVRHKSELERREGGKLAGESWYGLSFASDLRMFKGPKLITPTLAPLNSFSLDDSGCAFPQGAGGGCGIVPKSPPGLHSLLAILNSRLLTYYFQRISSCFQGGWFAYEPRYLRRIPICVAADGGDVAKQLETGAAELTRLSGELATAQTAFAAEALKREEVLWENRLDELVCELFGLTGDEIAMVQASFAAT